MLQVICYYVLYNYQLYYVSHKLVVNGKTSFGYRFFQRGGGKYRAHGRAILIIYQGCFVYIHKTSVINIYLMFSYINKFSGNQAKFVIILKKCKLCNFLCLKTLLTFLLLFYSIFSIFDRFFRLEYCLQFSAY